LAIMVPPRVERQNSLFEKFLDLSFDFSAEFSHQGR
jgi:hypothetical protein